MALLLTATSCDGPTEPRSDKEQRQQQEAIAVQGNAQVGMPGITKFTEKRLMRQLYEKRDQEKLLTYSYMPDMQGRLWHVCDSIGYGLPYGTQFSNPSKIVVFGGSTAYSTHVIPQAEPNGLFMPPTAEGTWLQCIGPNGKVEPMYVEPRVIVSPFKLNAFGDYQKP